MLASAAEDFRAALRARPAAAHLHERLATTYAARATLDRDPRDVAAAVAHFRRAIALAPADASVHVALFRFALTQRPALLDVALGAGQSALRHDPRAIERVLDEAVPLGLTDDQWLSIAPASASERLRLGLGLERRALVGPATRLARDARNLATAPAEDAAARWLLARLLLLQSDLDGALREIVEARGRHALNPELAFMHGEILRARGDAQCVDAYRAAVASAAKAPRGAADGALVAFDVADPSLRAVLNGHHVKASRLKYGMALGTYLTSVGLWRVALREMTDVVAQHGDHAAARFLLGAALDGVGEVDRALDEYRRAVALDGRAPFRSRLAQRLWDTRQHHQAIAEWRIIVEREPRNLEARLSLARALAKTGDRTGAAREYRAALEIDGTNAAARRELAQNEGR